ncbi:uncharacterized protein LOC130655316 [Hydractinia symbiolongicarpus]|uniref:uncharacterized protein LOC130655316 n=1 Tax=Hydractinia symbiolongicarpus TaxID=13093 RepID=UPI00255125E2|nr:uncharacterized protein LOC130655316 [Hydractinia symbiolongicarpus]
MEDNKTDLKSKSTSGIVYLSRIPPFMKPLKVRTMFSQYGEVGRLFLQPEDPSISKRRKKGGGSGRKQFTEGWVEFKDKRVAKAVASTLNNTNIGGKKRYYYHDDIWNVKYLPKFKWGHISEKLAYEKAAREQRMRTEISQAKREASFYLENVGKGKAIAAMEGRRKKKRKLTQMDDLPPQKVNRKIYQKPIAGKEFASTDILNPSLLSKIFTSG